mmetsp:Transcript_21543/g.55071  ORF Transcript_21543/g.55071 Transcript_21543/m.55071 type:complete len:111 (+) Transcript_21543:134-466(+)
MAFPYVVMRFTTTNEQSDLDAQWSDVHDAHQPGASREVAWKAHTISDTSAPVDLFHARSPAFSSANHLSVAPGSGTTRAHRQQNARGSNHRALAADSAHATLPAGADETP